MAGYTGYCASKAGLLGLVRSLAAELAPRRIQVNAICPGWVDTEMAWQGFDAMAGLTREEAYAEAMREVPLRRMSAARRRSRARSPGSSRTTRAA